MLCEATVAAMRNEAAAPKKATMELSVSAMLKQDDGSKRRKKPTERFVGAATSAGVARRAVTSTSGAASEDAAPKPSKTAAEIRAEFEAEKARVKAMSGKGNYVKTNLKRTWKSKVKNGARKKAAQHLSLIHI